jgi:hypothetical protein
LTGRVGQGALWVPYFLDAQTGAFGRPFS